MPSDVVLAAAIAGGVGLAGNAATVWATSLQRRSHERVERDRLNAESIRQQAEYREAERQRRLNSYEQFLAVVDELAQLGTTRTDASDDEYLDTMRRYRDLHSRILLFGSTPVTDAVREFHECLKNIHHSISSSHADPLWRQYVRGFRPQLDQVRTAAQDIMEAMRADVTAGFHDREASSD